MVSRNLSPNSENQPAANSVPKGVLYEKCLTEALRARAEAIACEMVVIWPDTVGITLLTGEGTAAQFNTIDAAVMLACTQQLAALECGK